MFAALQLCIALVVAPFLLMFAIGVACGAAFLVALLDMWNPRWWCSVKAHVGSVLRPAHHSRRASSPATSMMSPCRSTSSSGSESKEEEGEEEEKPLYERLIDDERRRVRSETEKVRARRRQQASTLPRLPSSAAGMGASLVSGLASAIDTPPSYNSLPARRPHRPGASNLRMYTTTHSDVNDSSSNNNSNNHNGASASYRDAAAELAALFGNKQQTAPASIPDGLLGQTTSPSIVLDQQRRPDRVGMSRMA
ncbi:hypothetical protein SYNPS1DRAFT_26345 [Syncephalis pseudoplumigaleata]|uniref:Uncharacterized protein n=1 Tax=Syncephalis pseudoplumigaleata TaxID=1712513 RepID=A0A4P9Z7Z1_9FUNG|nr:hypothetical protein SYNPS1DRAFT_26345 [Syncephalis pseudoplumigaleata]|eukprot:RKP28051.1 hypothetical protein SYNPS1DRAFT_26345 [Syncephalis pseudoplumigaleata]